MHTTWSVSGGTQKALGLGNISPESFRDGFSEFPSDYFEQDVIQSGDIVTVDGNASGSSYLVISKNPLAAGETVINSIDTFRLPIEAVLGLSRSVAAIGNEVAIGLVSGTQAAFTELSISALSQATTTLTITTATPHGLVAGRSFGIYGFADSRVNYPALVVASVTSPTVFTATAGPMGTIPSLTVGPLSGGFLYLRRVFPGGNRGTSIIFNSSGLTQAAFYVGSEANHQPSGTVNGQQVITVATSVSTSAVTSPYSFAFQPSSEYRVSVQPDKLQWSDAAADSTSAQTISRFNRTQVLIADADTKLSIRCANEKGLVMPVGVIVSAVKAGSTTATITFASAHGLTTADQILIYGIRDQTNFANLTTATAVASVVNATTITIAFGASATATSYGGYVSRANAQNLQPGAITQAIASATLTSGVLVLVGSATFSGLVVGDYVNVHGCRIDGTGADRGIDGAWKVVDTTTNLTLTALPGTTVPNDFTISNCGGAVIKRVDLRLSFIRLTEYDRDRVELVTRPSGDVSTAVPVVVQSGITVSTVPSTTPVSGNTAVDSGMPNPVAIGGRASNANISAMSASGDLVGLLMTMIGVGIFKPYCLPEAEWNFTASLTTTSDVNVQTAPGAGLKRHITHAWATNTGGAAVDVILKDGTTERIRITVPAGGFVPIPFPTGMVIAANAILNVALSAAGTVRFSAIGYTAP